jgi:hypothetical protein
VDIRVYAAVLIFWLPDVLITTVYWILCNVNKSVFLSCSLWYKITKKAIETVLFPIDSLSIIFHSSSLFLCMCNMPS